MYVSACFFYWNKNDKLIYISSPFSNQGLHAVTSNEFFVIHPKLQCLQIVYTQILDFFNEIKKKWD